MIFLKKGKKHEHSILQVFQSDFQMRHLGKKCFSPHQMFKNGLLMA